MPRSFFTFLCVVLSLSFSHCVGGLGKKMVYPSIVTPAMQSFFNGVEFQYGQGQYEHAFSGYQVFIEKYPHTSLTDEAHYKQGKIFFVKKRFDDALNKFAYLAKETPSPAYRAKALHMAGYAAFFLEDYSRALTYLKDVDDAELPVKLRVQFYSIAVKSARQNGSDEDFAVLSLLKLHDVYEEYAGKGLHEVLGANVISAEHVKERLNAWLSEPTPAQLPGWLKKYPHATPSYAYVNFKIAKAHADQGDTAKARRLLTQFITNFPRHPFVGSAQSLLTSLGGELKVATHSGLRYKVGVLLPLTGKYESHAESVIDGVRCAIGFHNICGEPTGIELLVVDSGFTSESTRAAIDELARQAVVAIIGPLSGELAVEAGMIATEKRVPIFPITQKSGVMTQGEYIFQVGFLAEKQVEAVVAEAFGRGYKTFGVFYPSNAYGETMAALFIQALERRGGRLTAKAEYQRGSPDKFAEARKLKASIGRVSAPGKGVGFDALFIPDSYQGVNALLNGLEFNQIKGIPLIGTSAWNDPELSLTIAEKFPNSYFVDLYNGNAKEGDVAVFRENFTRGFGRHPRVLEAYGYDIMMMIRQAVQEGGTAQIKEVLSGYRRFDGVTGVRGFKPGEGPEVESVVLRIKSTGLRQ